MGTPEKNIFEATCGECGKVETRFFITIPHRLCSHCEAAYWRFVTFCGSATILIVIGIAIYWIVRGG